MSLKPPRGPPLGPLPPISGTQPPNKPSATGPTGISDPSKTIHITASRMIPEEHEETAKNFIGTYMLAGLGREKDTMMPDAEDAKRLKALFMHLNSKEKAT